MRTILMYCPTQLYDKRYDFSFDIVNFPYICSNIPLSLAYGVYISQLDRCARTCSTYNPFLRRGRLLIDKLMLQGFLQPSLMSTFHKFVDRYNDLIYIYKLSLIYMISLLCFYVKLTWYLFWCTRCAFRLMKSFQWYAGRNCRRSKTNVKTIKKAWREKCP
jgi:hypothetical protein